MTQAQTQSATLAAPITPNPSDKQQTFLEHLHELRRRLFAVMATLLAATCLGYTLHDQIVHALLVPLKDQKLVYLTPGGGFDFIFKVSLYFGAALTIPMAVYQLYRYLSPLIVIRTRRFAAFIVISSCLLAVGGMTFGYYFALPAALKFLTSFAGDYIVANLTASSYLNFVTVYSLGLAALFQVPLVMLLINTINGPLKPSKLIKIEPYILLGAVVLAAMITPTPDIVNQAIVATPVILMYQLGIVMVVTQNHLRRPKKAHRHTVPAKEIKFVAPKAAPSAPLLQPRAAMAAAVSSPAVAVITQRPQPSNTKKKIYTVDGMVSAQRTTAPRPVMQPRRPATTALAKPRPSRPTPRMVRAVDGFSPRMARPAPATD